MNMEMNEVITNESIATKKEETNVYIPWISVTDTDRLPKRPEYDWVLGRIEYKEGGKGIPHVVELRDGVWYGANLDQPIEECLALRITHWKPIPDEDIE